MIKMSGKIIAIWLFCIVILPLEVRADPQPIAAMEFGNVDVGAPNQPLGHPSGHAIDRIRPRTVTISQGGTVVFRLPGGVHQVAIYDNGTAAADIDANGPRTGFVGCPGGPGGGRYIDDPNNRIAVLADPPCAAGPTLVQHSFNAPGRYLVICTFDAHFIEFNMYGWVIVE